MKYLLTCLALGIAFAAGAQTWNPDADFDNAITVEDLMALLSVFGNEWTADYPQDPEYDLAAYYVGNTDLFECIRTCTSNHAKIISLHEYAMFEDSIVVNAVGEWNDKHYWLDDRKLQWIAMHMFSTSPQLTSYVIYATDSEDSIYPFESKNCVCTGLVPAVE